MSAVVSEKETAVKTRAEGHHARISGMHDVNCRRIISYTSYSRTNDCTYNGYVNDNLEHNTMINIDTVAHMNMHYTQS